MAVAHNVNTIYNTYRLQAHRVIQHKLTDDKSSQKIKQTKKANTHTNTYLLKIVAQTFQNKKIKAIKYISTFANVVCMCNVRRTRFRLQIILLSECPWIFVRSLALSFCCCLSNNFLLNIWNCYKRYSTWHGLVFLFYVFLGDFW